MSKAPLYNAIMEYSKNAGYPWHMPGHKRSGEDVWKQLYSMDFTEIPGLDEYHSPEGIILEAQQKAASIYGVKDSFFLINGSTVGLLAAIGAVCKSGDGILIGRNCHKSVYNAVELFHLEPVYCYPEWLREWDMYGGMSPRVVEEMLKENPGVKAVVITSPTYEGVVSDIIAISEVVHAAGAVLIVDEAHGAHLPFFAGVSAGGSEDRVCEDAELEMLGDVACLPASAISLGADLVIQSLHKTLPAMTQTAILHRVSERVSREQLFHYVSLLQSTSPSYVMMASIDYAIHTMDENKEMLEQYCRNIEHFREKMKRLHHVGLLGQKDIGNTCARDYDSGKLLLSVKGTDMKGADLAQALLEAGHVVEMYSRSYVLCMTSVMDQAEALDSLFGVLEQIDSTIRKTDKKDDITISSSIPVKRLSVETAMGSDSCLQELKACQGRISADYVYAYPPGSPILVPGEEITEDVISEIRQDMEMELNLKGVHDGRIRVISESI